MPDHPGRRRGAAEDSATRGPPLVIPDRRRPAGHTASPTFRSWRRVKSVGGGDMVPGPELERRERLTLFGRVAPAGVLAVLAWTVFAVILAADPSVAIEAAPALPDEEFLMSDDIIENRWVDLREPLVLPEPGSARASVARRPRMRVTLDQDRNPRQALEALEGVRAPPAAGTPPDTPTIPCSSLSPALVGSGERGSPDPDGRANPAPRRSCALTALSRTYDYRRDPSWTDGRLSAPVPCQGAR